MPRPKSTSSKTNGNAAKSSNGAKLGFEEILWAAADKQRGHMDAAEYKHVVLGLIFLKYISDAFQELYDKLEAQEYADPEDRDEYTAENIFRTYATGSRERHLIVRMYYLQGTAKEALTQISNSN